MINIRLAQQYLDDSLMRTPDKAAVLDGKSSLTYRELASLSNKLAHLLMELGVGRHQRVAICLERSVHCLVAIFGILKADAVYVPIDPKSPPERWRSLLADCRPAAMVCDSSTLNKAFPRLAGGAETVPVIVLGQRGNLAEELAPNCVLLAEAACDDQAPQYLNDESDIAYILYTSGSSGKPKGVMTTHLNIRNYIDWAVDHFELGREERILGTAPFHFDMSTFDVYCPVKAGATLCVAAESSTLFPEQLVRFIEGEGVTAWKGISSLLMYMDRAGVVRKERMPTLKKVLFGGEALHGKYLINWMRSCPDKSFYNVYGPTETTGISMSYRVETIPSDPGARIPIGLPGKGAEVMLIREDGTPAPRGEAGELCISGACLSPGYLNDRGKTGEAFIPHPLDGEGLVYRTGDMARLENDGYYRFLGRKDRQVKYMGYRIELEDIEKAMLVLDGIRDAAAIMTPSGTSGLTEICAFFEGDQGLSPARLKEEASRLLPPYMVPRRMVRMESIPRNERGKVRFELLREFLADNGGRGR